MKSRSKPLLVFIIISLVLLLSYFFYREGTLPVNKNIKKTQIFVVPKGDSLVSITRKLEKEGLIRNRIVFFLVVKQLGIEKKIQAGDYRLSKSMNAHEIARNLTHGTLDVWVTVIEGLRKEEVAEAISENLNITQIKFIKEAPEGYLFPDTYLMPKKASSEAVISIMTNNFNNKFTDELKQKAQNKGLNNEEAVILASLVEREAKFDADRPKVAGVILNRLKIGMKLDIDATVQYALGYQPDEKTWWKQGLTDEDKLINSLYNTYRVAGLPPGPISNPGLASLEAVANADTSVPYLYYLHDEKGRTHFARTFEEHQANIQKYLK